MQFALSVSVINLIEAMYAEKGRGITALYVRNKVFGEIKPGVNTILAIVDKIYAGDYVMNQAGAPFGYVVV